MGQPRGHWGAWLDARTKLGARFSRDFIRGAVGDSELAPRIREIARALDQDENDLVVSDFVGDRVDILQTNLQFLFETLEHGGKKALAAALDLDPTTVSRWLNGTYVPHGQTLQQLVSYFGLPAGTDLRSEPVFLSVEPIAITQRRVWLHQRIDALPLDALRELYPALRLLLDER
jgi:transcriptional regulator with XRE-family HTH domain